jgi:hypothetical protein
LFQNLPPTPLLIHELHGIRESKHAQILMRKRSRAIVS